MTDDHCIFDHRLKTPFVLHVALIYITASTESAAILCAFGKVSLAGRLGIRETFVMQACMAAFSLQFAVPLQTHFPSLSGNREKSPNLWSNAHSPYLSQGANPGAESSKKKFCSGIWAISLCSVEPHYYKLTLVPFRASFGLCMTSAAACSSISQPASKEM